MRLEALCEGRLGLTRELPDLLVLRSADLRGIEIDPTRRIYPNFAELEFTNFSSLMAETRCISGIVDVRTMPWMPSECEHLALSAPLETLSEPILSPDMKSRVEMANPASCQLFAHTQEWIRNHAAAQLINGFSLQRWLGSNPQGPHNEHAAVSGQNLLMEITLVHSQGENQEQMLTGAVVMLHSIVRVGCQP